jgi:hypothetical protein
MKSQLYFQIIAKSAIFAVVIQWRKQILVQWGEVKTVGHKVQKFPLEGMQLPLCPTCIIWGRRTVELRDHTSRQKPRSLKTTGTKQSWQQCRKHAFAFMLCPEARVQRGRILLRFRIKTAKLSGRKTFLKVF